MSNAVQLLGAHVVVKTTFGEEMEGEVFCFDATGTKTLILKDHAHNGRGDFGNFKVVNTDMIESLRAIERGEQWKIEEPLPTYNQAVVELRERRAVERAENVREQWGVGVTQEAQELFEALHKTHPDCRWEGERISVMGVYISRPWDAHHITAQRDTDPRVVERLQKVVSSILDKQLHQRRTKEHQEVRRQAQRVADREARAAAASSRMMQGEPGAQDGEGEGCQTPLNTPLPQTDLPTPKGEDGQAEVA